MASILPFLRLARPSTGAPARAEEELSMRAKIIHEGMGEPFSGERTFALIFETGEEVIACLTEFATDRSLTACHFTAIGAFSDVTLGFFDWERKTYKKIPLPEQVEVISLL
jgi:hypothetical protein